MSDQKMSKTDIENAIRISILERLFGVEKDNIPVYVYKVTVRNVFDNSYRVNVFLSGEDKNPIPYSYLVKFSIDQGVISSVPDIVRNLRTEFDAPKKSAVRIY